MNILSENELVEINYITVKSWIAESYNLSDSGINKEQHIEENINTFIDVLKEYLLKQKY